MSESLNEEDLEILACPHCKADVELEDGKVVCTDCGREFPIEDGVPNMLPDDLME